MGRGGATVLTDDDLRAVLSAVGVDAQVRALEVTASTNTTALEMVRDGAPPWSLVTAGHQTAGRGRLDRAWIDRPGGSVLCSVLVPPVEPVDLMPLLAGAAMAGALREVASVQARCKWPNDVLVDGAKVCGILVERLVDGDPAGPAVIGVGVNLADPGVEGAGAVGATDPRAILIAFLRGMRADHGDPASIRARWLELSDTIGRQVRASAPGTAVEGVATGLTDRGELIVRTGEGDVILRAGEITHLR